MTNVMIDVRVDESALEQLRARSDLHLTLTAVGAEDEEPVRENDPQMLAEQDIVLTVPASFDEEARELTVRAAEEAGLAKLTLLEEPAAAFYSWIANNFARSRRLLFDGQVVLICDVGGGTSDFSLIKVSRDGDRINFTRTAVGKHLLLGGDNLDLTLAWLAETKLGKQLSIRQRSGLRFWVAYSSRCFRRTSRPMR